MQVRSTPDALWDAPSLRLLRPTAVECLALTRGRLLRGLDLAVPAGTRLLLVSEPDASASLLLRILAGLARPRGGEVRLAGRRNDGGAAWARRVAYLGPRPGIHAWMTPREALALAARLLELGSAADRRIAAAVTAARIPVGLLDRPVRRGGRAMLERTGFAAALLAEPEILLLDDPLASVEADERATLLRIPGERRTVLIASRLPTREAGIVDRVAVLGAGRVAFLGSPADVIRPGQALTRRALLDAAAVRAA